MRLLYFVALLFVCFSSCRKDEVVPVGVSHQKKCDTTWIDVHANDTIIPSPFLAAFPGSWREYDNGDRDMSIEWREMPVYSWSKNDDECPVVTRTFVYVCYLTSNYPIFEEWYIHGRYRLINKNYHTELRPIIGEVGMTYNSTETSDPDVDFGSSWIRRFEIRVDSLLTTMVVHGETYENVLRTTKVSEFYYYKYPSNKFYSTWHSYYAEKKGLIYRQFFYDGWDWEDSNQSLTNYHISPY